MKIERTRLWKKFLAVGAMTALVAGTVSAPTGVYAGGTIKANDDQWISVGMGIRSSFNAVEGASSAGHYSNDFKVDNARIYINGSIHKYVKFTFNTDCFNCAVGAGSGFGGNSSIGLLDAIGKFEFDEKFNIWAGRTLVPSERGELNGPFYHATYDGFRTPFFSADQSGNVPGGTNTAGNGGLYGRDNGVVFFGKIHPFGTHLMYVGSVFTGVRGGPNTGNNLMYAGRLQWNLLNDEDNPGYYTSGTYYGTAGDVVAIAANVQHQAEGAGSATLGKSDFTGLSVDLLIEKLLPNNLGVFTLNGEFKRFFANYGTTAAANINTSGSNTFGIFNGDSWTVYGLYLIPQQVGIGRFQPYFRFTSIDPRYSAMRQEYEYGVNYIISGHNARISAYGRYGDIATKGLTNFDTDSSGQKVDSFHVALQMQY